MKLESSQNIEQKPVEMEGARDCQVRWLISASDGAPNFAMREFEVAPGGYTPRHSHPYEHEIFVVEGQGEVFEGDTPRAIGRGDVVLIAPDEVHQFRNTSEAPLKFLCLIPNDAAQKSAALTPECGTEK